MLVNLIEFITFFQANVLNKKLKKINYQYLRTIINIKLSNGTNNFEKFPIIEFNCKSEITVFTIMFS